MDLVVSGDRGWRRAPGGQDLGRSRHLQHPSGVGVGTDLIGIILHRASKLLRDACLARLPLGWSCNVVTIISRWPHDLQLRRPSDTGRSDYARVDRMPHKPQRARSPMIVRAAGITTSATPPHGPALGRI